MAEGRESPADRSRLSARQTELTQAGVGVGHFGLLGGDGAATGVAHIHGRALQMAQRSGLLAKIGPDHVFETKPAAVAWAQSRSKQHGQGQQITPAAAESTQETGGETT